MNKVNLNNASVEDLSKIEGIGRNNAERIVKYRNEHGKIKNAEELKNIFQISDTRLEKLKEQVQF